MFSLKRIPILARIALFLALGATAWGAYQLLNSTRKEFQETVSSLNAYVCGGLTAITSGLGGQVLLIAGEGEQVKKGDLILEIASPEAIQIKLEAEKQLQEIIPKLTPSTFKILEGFFLIPEDSSALSASLEAAFTETNRLSERVAALSLAHAKSQLAARKLELQEKKGAGDRELLRKLHGEEARLNSALERAREEYEVASDCRAALEASLRARRLLEQSAAALRGQQKQLFTAAQSAFSRLSGAERALADSRKIAPSDAVVVKTYFKPGDVATAGRVAVMLEPVGEDAFWIVASFAAQDAEAAASGAGCRVAFKDGKGINLPGRVLERIYPDDDLLPPEESLSPSQPGGKAGKKTDLTEDEAHFKIRLDVAGPEMLLYLQTRPDALVTINKDERQNLN